jgi:ABC-type Mn2+/Zn2+ transport system permease subunit
MLVTPAATAQLLTVRFGRLMLTAAGIGVVSAVVGLYISYWLDVASGATIVLVESGVFLLALALGPRTGLLARNARRNAAPASSVPDRSAVAR